MCCRPRLRMCKPQVTSETRVKGFTKANVANFFDIFVPLLCLINISPYSLINYDKTDLSFSIKYAKLSPLRVSKGLQQRDSLATIAVCMNATVTYVRHLLVFPRSNMKAELLESATPGSIAARHKAGWVQK